MRRAVFFDRDGVLNRQVVRGGKPYPPNTLEEFEIFPEAPELLRQLKSDGFQLFVVSNQPDVARGTMPQSTVESMARLLREVLPLDGIYHCYHDDADNCLCRKPRPGLLLQIAREHGIDLGGSYMIGDRWRDIDAGAQAGTASILIDYVYDERVPDSEPDARVASLKDAVEWIRAREVESAVELFQTVILAGGLGTRLGALGESLPKALMDINSEPFLAHQLRLLARKGVRKVLLCVGYRGEMIREFAGSGAQFGMEIEYSFDGPLLRGTAGAIRNALPLLDARFFVLYGDSYLQCNYESVQRDFEASGKRGLMTVFLNEGRWDSSNIEYECGHIVAYDKVHKTPRMRYIDYGLGVFHRSVFEELAPEGAHDLASVYGNLLRSGDLGAAEVPDRFYEIGSLEGIEELKTLLRTKS